MLMALAAATFSFAATTQAQDLTPEMMCLRYAQNLERTLRIPSGLLTAISLAETGRTNPETGQMGSWPWTINVNGEGRYFETKEEAVEETRKLLDSGQRSIDVGCMQVNLRYHPTAFRSIDEAFDPMNNVSYGAKFLLSLRDLQGSWAQAVERYHSADDGRRAEYRERVIGLWNREARNLVMTAVLDENNDTPYHLAIRDFVGGRFAEALDKYQGIVDKNPNDRIGLLGVAMCYEELGRDTETMQAYARYLGSEPSNETILTKVIQKASTKTPEAARADLEAVHAAGVDGATLMSALSEIAATQGDNETAFKYASEAAQRAPNVAAYQLNAGVLADKLNRTAAAVQHYEQFMLLFARNPVLVDTPIDGIRQRAVFLRTRL